jgi:PiT family inorganic phosphate transporter
MTVPLFALITAALGFAFLYGFHDCGNAVGALVTSRSLNPRAALILAAIAYLCGPLFFGVAVATTLGRDIVVAQSINIAVVLAALGSAILWNLLTWYLAIPSSSSHALIGGLLGAASAAHGLSAIQLPGLIKVVTWLFAAPLLSFVIGYGFLRLLFFLVRNATPSANWVFRRAQIPATFILALSQGAMSAQKPMGMLTLGLMALGYETEFAVPQWVILASAGALAMGALCSGVRLIKTVGVRLYRVRPIDAFGAQVSAALVVIAAALLGGPVSASQVTSSALLGVGTAERASKIRWNVAADIATTWLFTMPISAVLGAGLYLLFDLFVA